MRCCRALNVGVSYTFLFSLGPTILDDEELRTPSIKASFGSASEQLTVDNGRPPATDQCVVRERIFETDVGVRRERLAHHGLQ